MSFVTSGYAERATLDFQIKLHNISHDLEQLGGALGYVRPEGSPPVARNETAVWKCPLGRENTVEGKGKLAVSKADFLAVLAKHPALVQRLCTVYFQDYIWCARRPRPPPAPAARARICPSAPWPLVALTGTPASPRATLAAWASRFRPSARAVGSWRGSRSRAALPDGRAMRQASRLACDGWLALGVAAATLFLRVSDIPIRQSTITFASQLQLGRAKLEGMRLDVVIHRLATNCLSHVGDPGCQRSTATTEVAKWQLPQVPRLCFRRMTPLRWELNLIVRLVLLHSALDPCCERL